VLVFAKIVKVKSAQLYILQALKRRIQEMLSSGRVAIGGVGRRTAVAN
jgi:hypothetical protein